MSHNFYQQHLNRVSRSFAFCIEQLQGSLREQVGLAYLICRLLDTVEDAHWIEDEAQRSQFMQFNHFIQHPPAMEEVRLWGARFPRNIPEGEKILLSDAERIFKDLHGLPVAVRSVIQDAVLSMSRGMMFFMCDRKQDVLRLSDLYEVNQYCFFVAGVVGEVLTRLAAASQPGMAVSDQKLVDAFHFGLFLQKVNLLKDQKQDECSGRYLVPSRPAVFESLKLNAARSLVYLLELPQKLKSYRVFCAWSFFLGLASLPWIEESWRRGTAIKIPRAQTRLLLAKVERVVEDNGALLKIYHELIELLPKFESDFETEATIGTELCGAPWFADLYRGRLLLSSAQSLGLRSHS